MTWIVREIALLSAYALTGSFLLLSVWATRSFEQNLSSQYKYDSVSVILKPGTEVKAKNFFETNSNVIRFEFQSPKQNRVAISDSYPELKDVLEPLSDDFFPSSALISARNAADFQKDLSRLNINAQDFVIHQPPENMKNFLQLLSSSFLCLWIFALILLLYFQLEQLATRERGRWSLMKMLGATSAQIFKPIFLNQIVRLIGGSLISVLVTFFVSRYALTLFSAEWGGPSVGLFSGFLAISICLGSAILFALFHRRLKQVALA